MKHFIASEYNQETLVFTGKTETYPAENITKAVECVLYAKRLHNGNAFVGPTGQVVHDGRFGYTITERK